MNEKFFDLKKEKQDRMINAALKVFAENGYRKASTDEIVKEAGISKGLLFHYFTSKSGLYAFIMDYSVKYLGVELTSAVGSSGGDFFALRGRIEKGKAQAMKSFPYIQFFLLQARGEDCGEMQGVIEDKEKELEEIYRQIYEKADYDRVCGIEKNRLIKILDYTCNGLLGDRIRSGAFQAQTYLEEAEQYIRELEYLCRPHEDS